MSSDHFVFAYGSLATECDGAAAVLRGHERVWGVAMDNSHDLPGYKHYLLRSDGSRPDVFVAFVDLRPEPRRCATGRCVAVDGSQLGALDRRERNYRRVDVTADLEPAPAGTVWAYLGSGPGRTRFHAGLRRGSAVISRDYLEHVRAGLAALAPGELEQLDRSTELDGLEVWDLERVEHRG